MRGSGAARRLSARYRSHRAGARALFALVALGALSVMLPAGASAAGITFVAPAGSISYPDHQSEGPVGYDEALAFRTTDTRPTIGITADGGTQLQCHFDDVHVTQPCGGPAPGCAALCGSFQPTSPLGPDSDEFSRAHFLAVDVVDADGNSVASEWVNIDVDTTPPVTKLDTAGGVLSSDGKSALATAPLHPTFAFQVTDSNSVGTDLDTAACAWGPASTTATFAPCGSKTASGSFTPPALPYRHRLYRLQVRGTDDFGRSTTASGLYDPIPCVLSIHRPARLGSLLSSGIATTVRCDTDKHVAVAAFAFMVDGNRSATPRGAVSNNPILGEYRIAKPAEAFTVSRRLRLSRAARTALAHARSLGLVLAAGDPDTVETGFADDSLSYQSFTLHR